MTGMVAIRWGIRRVHDDQRGFISELVPKKKLLWVGAGGARERRQARAWVGAGGRGRQGGRAGAKKHG